MADRNRVKKKEKSVHRPTRNKKRFHYYFRLFIDSNETNSRMAKKALKDICKKYLRGNYKLEIIDVVKDFKLALEEKVFFAPTLIIETPEFKSRVVGSLNDSKKLMDILGLSETIEDK